MKVCTDACLFGSIAASTLANIPGNTVLDIGTGTGLLSLMVAQKNNTAIIDGVEVDEAAAQQATGNFAASAFKERLTVHHTPIQQFTSAHLFDFIISNPPFFEKDLKSDDSKRNIALHSSALNLEELFDSIERLLKPGGTFGVLLPCHRSDYFEKLAAGRGFHITQKTLVKQTPKHNCFRSILFFSKIETATKSNEITIRDADNNYSHAFTQLLKDYYLYL